MIPRIQPTIPPTNPPKEIFLAEKFLVPVIVEIFLCGAILLIIILIAAIIGRFREVN